MTSVDRSFHGPRGRPIAGAVEHTAPSPSGSSGAPVLDTDGRVVGVNTHRLEHGFYLARAADQALRDAVASLVDGRTIERVTLGVALAAPHVAARLRQAVGLPSATACSCAASSTVPRQPPPASSRATCWCKAGDADLDDARRPVRRPRHGRARRHAHRSASSAAPTNRR